VPERPGPWDLLDRPSDPVVADTVAIDSRLAHFRSLADAMRVEGQRLSKIASGEALAGKYADELRSASGDVAKDLNQVVGRYDAVVEALVAFQPAVDAALTGSAAALDDAINASAAQRQADSMQLATAVLFNYRDDQLPEGLPGTELTPQQVQANEDKAVATEAAAARLREAKARLAGVLANLDDVGRQAAATIRRSFNDGLTDSGWDRFKYAFKKFLKILVKVLTYIGMALAVIAILIPGVGPLIFAAGAAIAGVALAAEIGLMALGEGSWLDLGMAIAGLFTLGVGKLFGPAINSGLRSAMGSIKGVGKSISVGSTGYQRLDKGMKILDRIQDPLGSAAASTGGAAGKAAGAGKQAGTKVASGSGSAATRGVDNAPKTDLELAHEWGVPPGSTKVPHPDDLGANAGFIKPGTHSWKSDTNVTYTRMTDWVGYKGISTKGSEIMREHGAKRLPEPAGNGNPNPEWKGFYATDNIDGAKQYASQWDDATARDLGGDVLRYQHNREVTLVQPAGEATDPALARALFPENDPKLPLIDGLGDRGMIMRNPLAGNEDGFEFIVPWSLSEKGALSLTGRNVPGKRAFAEPTWEDLS